MYVLSWPWKTDFLGRFGKQFLYFISCNYFDECFSFFKDKISYAIIQLSTMFSVSTVVEYHGEESKGYQFNTEKINHAKFYLHAICIDLLISWQDWYFVTKIVLTYCEKKLFKWSRKTFEIRGWRPRICTIH